MACKKILEKKNIRIRDTDNTLKRCFACRCGYTGCN